MEVAEAGLGREAAGPVVAGAKREAGVQRV